MKALDFCMGRNDKLGKYDLKFNNIGERGKSASISAMSILGRFKSRFESCHRGAGFYEIIIFASWLYHLD